MKDREFLGGLTGLVLDLIVSKRDCVSVEDIARDWSQKDLDELFTEFNINFNVPHAARAKQTGRINFALIPE